MEVISFHESDRQDHWLEEIKRSDWKSGAFLYELLSQGTFFDTVGENSKVLLLIDGDELISYCTYAQKDDIQPTELTPWIGFVYTFPEHRGHRYVELLFNEIERLAQEEQVSQVYISTNHVGLYEKYGCEFLTEMNDLDGNPSRVYVKKNDITEDYIKETESLETKNDIKKSGIKKVFKYLTSIKKWAVLKRAFHIWQITPPKLAPLSESTQECASCGTEYQGNYCPRCGQSATVDRFSFKKAVQHFLNVWGMGNRSMFRSLRDLMLRPGYMIRDYLRGMQSAYFPPFKMFFILLTFFLIIQQGLKLDVDATEPQSTGKQTEMVKQGKENVKQEMSQAVEGEKEQQKSPLYKIGLRFAQFLMALWEKNPTIFSFLTLMLFSWPLYFFLRHSPNVPDLRFSEFIVAIVYTSNSFSLFSMIGNILNLDILNLIAVFMIFVTLKQFSGYTKRRILGYMILTFAISFTAIAIVTLSGIGISYLLVSK